MAKAGPHAGQSQEKIHRSATRFVPREVKGRWSDSVSDLDFDKSEAVKT